jgi:hypothetical protein
MLLGLPSETRKQIPLYQQGGLSYLLECTGRGDLPPPTPAMGLGAGGRVGFTVTGDGDHSGLVVGPGVDLWATGPIREVVLAPTVDLSLRHPLWPQCRWQFDVNLGAGYFCGRATDTGFPRLFPLLGLSTGFRY